MTDLLNMTAEAPIGRAWHTVQVAPIQPSAETLANIEAIGDTFAGTVRLQKREAERSWLRDWDQMVRIATGPDSGEIGMAIYNSIRKGFQGCGPVEAGYGYDSWTSIVIGGAK